MEDWLSSNWKPWQAPQVFVEANKNKSCWCDVFVKANEGSRDTQRASHTERTTWAEENYRGWMSGRGGEEVLVIWKHGITQNNSRAEAGLVFLLGPRKTSCLFKMETGRQQTAAACVDQSHVTFCNSCWRILTTQCFGGVGHCGITVTWLWHCDIMIPQEEEEELPLPSTLALQNFYIHKKTI